MEESIKLLNPFLDVLGKTWIKETSAYPNQWTKIKNYIGQDDISVLLIQEYIGGDIIQYPINISQSHHYNLINDRFLIDPAPNPSLDDTVYNEKDFIISRNLMLTSEDIKNRYLLFKEMFFDNLKQYHPELITNISHKKKARA